MGKHSRSRVTRLASRPSRTPATIESLSSELFRLSSHRDDDIAVNAAALHAELTALGPSPSAQQFEKILSGVFKARIALPEGDLGAWRAAHGIARAVFVKLVQAHRANVLRRRTLV